MTPPTNNTEDLPAYIEPLSYDPDIEAQLWHATDVINEIITVLNKILAVLPKKES